MLNFLLRRFVLIVIVLFGLSILTFFIARIVPSDPVMLAAGPRASREQIENLRHEYGYDKPLVEQYIQYISDLSRGDWGRSPILRREVSLCGVIPTKAPAARLAIKAYTYASVQSG